VQQAATAEETTAIIFADVPLQAALATAAVLLAAVQAEPIKDTVMHTSGDLRMPEHRHLLAPHVQ
jgi:hypothetical protein